MRIAVRMGHMKTGQDASANGIINEYEGIRQYAPHVINFLMRAGHEVVDVTPSAYNGQISDSLGLSISKANLLGVDLYVSLHLNAFNGKAYGCEVICNTNNAIGKEIAKRIAESVSSKCGFANRGAKPNDRGLAEINKTNMTAVIVEPFFCDNADDVAKFNPEKLGKAIAEGIHGAVIGDAKKQEIDVVALINKVTSNPKQWLDLRAKTPYFDEFMRKMIEGAKA
jgi:N-acetylmuramoyl-L-alanine amidase